MNTAEQHGPSQIETLYQIIPSAAQPASIEKLNFWLQSTYPECIAQFAKVLYPTASRLVFTPLKISYVPAVQYFRRIPYLSLEGRYRIDRVYFLVNMSNKPFTIIPASFKSDADPNSRKASCPPSRASVC